MNPLGTGHDIVTIKSKPNKIESIFHGIYYVYTVSVLNTKKAYTPTDPLVLSDRMHNPGFDIQRR